jgi:hypothetical protein
MLDRKLRVLKISKEPRYKLSRAEKRNLHILRGNAELAVLPTDNVNAMVILNTAEYTENVVALMEYPEYKKLAKDHTQSMKPRTTFALKGLHFLKMSPNSCDHLARSHPDYASSLRYTRQESP